MLRSFSIFFVSILFCYTTQAQPGCTDPQANNYDADATQNDGSCLYGLTEAPPTQIASLPNTLSECSGLTWVNNSLWVHNDGGNEDEIYRIDTLTGAILQSVIIASADNNDWEDLCSDEEYLYIGDFGNNPGNRMDLSILRVAKSDLNEVAVNADVIEFSYSDQVDFSENANNHNFDCEAMIVFNDSIHLFTKNWADSRTKHYILPTTPGTHTAELVESFDVELLVTGADISEDGVISLLGYNTIGFSFMWLLFDYQGSQFFSGNKRRIALGFGLETGQTEGIAFRENGYGYICSERFEAGPVESPQKLLSFSTAQWTDFFTPTHEISLDLSFSLFPNPAKDRIEVQLPQAIDQWLIYDAEGKLIRLGKGRAGATNLTIPVSGFMSGVYIFQVLKDEKRNFQNFIKN